MKTIKKLFALLAALGMTPIHGMNGGSSSVLTPVSPASVVLIGSDDANGQHKINVPRSLVPLFGALYHMVQGKLWKEYNAAENVYTVDYSKIEGDETALFTMQNIKTLVKTVKDTAGMSNQEAEKYLAPKNIKELAFLLQMGVYYDSPALVKQPLSKLIADKLTLPENLKLVQKRNKEYIGVVNGIDRFDMQGAIKDRVYLNNRKLCEKEIAHGNIVCSVAISHDGKWFATGSYDKKARIIEMATGEVKKELLHRDIVCSVAISHDGKWLITGATDNKARIIEMATYEVKKVISHGGEGAICSVAISPDGKWLVTGSSDKKARIIEIATGEVKKTIAHGHWVSSVAISPDGTWLLTGSLDNKARIIEMATGRVKREMIHGDSVLSVAISPDGKWLVTGGNDQKARIVEVVTGVVKKVIEHESSVLSVAISPGSKLLVTGAKDSKARIIEMATGAVKKEIEHRDAIYSAAISPGGGKWLVTGSGAIDKKARTFSLARPALKQLLEAIAASK